MLEIPVELSARLRSGAGEFYKKLMTFYGPECVCVCVCLLAISKIT